MSKEMITEIDPIAKVAEFMEVFEMPTNTALWKKLVQEEMGEVREAVGHLIKEITDVVYVCAGLANCYEQDAERGFGKSSEEILTPQELALMEGLRDVFEDVLPEAFHRVHESNMSKLDEDGKPVRREDGKVLKGPCYEPPVMSDLVDQCLA